MARRPKTLVPNSRHDAGSGMVVIRPSTLAVEAATLMEQHRITSVLVVDDAGLLVGALNSNDLMRAKVI